jgi:hypothetical protein
MASHFDNSLVSLFSVVRGSGGLDGLPEGEPPTTYTTETTKFNTSREHESEAVVPRLLIKLSIDDTNAPTEDRSRAELLEAVEAPTGHSSDGVLEYGSPAPPDAHTITSLVTLDPGDPVDPDAWAMIVQPQEAERPNLSRPLQHQSQVPAWVTDLSPAEAAALASADPGSAIPDEGFLSVVTRGSYPRAGWRKV